jgi:hypothetical protein
MAVYLITCRERGVCKIGHAQNAKSRLASLQTASPSKLVLEAVLTGDRGLESHLHQRFARHRLKGEWFTITDELDAFIAEAVAEPCLPLGKACLELQRVSDEQSVEESLALHRKIFAEGMEALSRLGPVPTEPTPVIHRVFTPVSAEGGQFNNRYVIRGPGRREFCHGLNLTWDQADRLCDVFEEIRANALDFAECLEQAA